MSEVPLAIWFLIKTLQSSTSRILRYKSDVYYFAPRQKNERPPGTKNDF